jgi:hypothetical protein
VRIIFILNFIPFFCFVKDFITKKILLSDGLSWLFRVFNHVCSLGFIVPWALLSSSYGDLAPEARTS